VSRHDFDADIQAVRTALVRLHDSDEVPGINRSPNASDEIDAIDRHRSLVRRALISELIEFLDAREDIVDLQVRNGLDPLELLLHDQEKP
jgi:hypothetical protein